MAGRRSRGRRFVTTAHKPHGVIRPRVQRVGPEHFGIVSVDCAKARFKWMLCDFYGKVLIPRPRSNTTGRNWTSPSPDCKPPARSTVWAI